MTKAPSKTKAKPTEPEETTSASKDILEAAMRDYKEDHHNTTVNSPDKKVWKVSTGSLLLDVATGGVRPSLWRLCGQNNSGKTPQMLEIIRNILENVPNSKALWTIAEGRGLSDENRQRCGLKFVTRVEDWEPGTVFVLYTNVFELFVKVIKDLVKNNPEGFVYAFVIDSVDGLILRDDAAKDITENNRVAGTPMLAKKMLQSLSLGMFTYGHRMGLISQVTSEIKLDPYAKTANRGGNFSGGNALLHASDVIIQYEQTYQGDFILDSTTGKFNDGKTKAVGVNARVTMIKSVLESTKKTSVQYPIKYGRKPSGIWVERELVDLLLFFQQIVRGVSGWITFTDTLRNELKEAGIELPEKIQGMPKLYDYVEDNVAVRDYLLTKFRGMLGA